MDHIAISISKKELAAVLEAKHAQGAHVEIHPLGFLRLPLGIPNRLEAGMYLHVWPDELLSLDKREKIHCHIFDLRSRILCGKLRNVLYEVDFNADGPDFLNDVVFHGSKSKKVLVQKVACHQRSYIDYDPGDIYSMPKGVYHATVIEYGFTATLMHKINVDINAHPYTVSRTESSPDQVEFEHAGFDQQHAWSLVNEALERMV